MSIKSGMKKLDLMNFKSRNESISVLKDNKSHTERKKPTLFQSHEHLENEFYSDRLGSLLRNEEKKNESSLKSGSKLEETIQSFP